MRRPLAAIALIVLNGCGSCLDEKAPEVEQPPTIKTVSKTTEAGVKRPILVGDGVNFGTLAKRDAGDDEAR